MSDYTAVESTVERFQAAVSRRAVDMLSQMLFPFWRCKRIAENGQIHVESCADLISRRLTDQFAPTAISQLTSIQLCFGDFAIARTDAWAKRATSFHLLFKEGNTWRMAGTTSVEASTYSRDGTFTTRNEEATVLGVLGEYYRAVTAGDGRTIERIFAMSWEMKNHQNGRVVVEDKRSFASRIDARPVSAYDQDRQIADVQIVADRLAYVRIDKPSVPVSTVFLLLKQGNVWLILDKAWSEGNKV